ncbi:hypothetical protein SeMB42_g01072 [Synchytrium endobioticum]|uniref:Protein kintoun n=1 Tax=Synchytrium endobioticum TaxID=286115 RepID=A0A507DNN5_9FUNG|nr:hypothetical protein SeLEV6574_g02443 [Synchytrium endobioticum]TPX53021.1 hypothetical protein SeMB42_g01072 [Synchytrium endobioticum]
MAARAREDRFNELNMTEDEAKRIQQSFQDEKFRSLFAEYVQELSDPKNRELYEREIAALEAEQGNKIRFVKPTEGHVLKTRLLEKPSPSASEIRKATAESKADNQKKGQFWSIPYSLSNPREDVDHANIPCLVYDCVLHPDTYMMGRNNAAFDKMLNDTAIEGIEKRFNVTLDRKIKTPKMKYKGVAVPTIIRERDSIPKSPAETSSEYIKSLQEQQQKPQQVPDIAITEKVEDVQACLVQELDDIHVSSKPKPVIEIPKYSIAHRGSVDYSNFMNNRERMDSPRPEYLIVRVDLPRVTTVSEVSVDTTESTFDLNVPHKYSLTAKLPFPVNHERGHAKFDKTRRILTATLPVISSSISVASAPDAAPKLADEPQANVDTATPSLDSEPEVTAAEEGLPWKYQSRSKC